jgi:hypothetical protein
VVATDEAEAAAQPRHDGQPEIVGLGPTYRMTRTKGNNVKAFIVCAEGT